MSMDPKDTPDDEDAVAQLIARAGARPACPPDIEAQIRAAAHAEWRNAVAQRARTLRMRWAAAAAVMLSALGLAWYVAGVDSQLTLAAVAQLDSNSESVHIESRSTAPRAADHQIIYEGDRLTTDGSGARLSTPSGVSMRVAPKTSLRWSSQHTLELASGALYVDSGSQHAPLTIQTAFGSVTHVGTRYCVETRNNGVTISVREGTVAIDYTHVQLKASANEQVGIDSAGHVSRTTITPYGPQWTWAEALAQSYDIEARTLDDFLTWVALETGRKLEFADPQTRRSAHATVLHGSVANLLPSQALQAVLSTTELEAVIDNERLLIRSRPG